MIPMDGMASTEVSPTFSTISSREQAERDRERLAAMNGKVFVQAFTFPAQQQT